VQIGIEKRIRFWQDQVESSFTLELQSHFRTTALEQVPSRHMIQAQEVQTVRRVG
jgi:hypothetical protein